MKGFIRRIFAVCLLLVSPHVLAEIGVSNNEIILGQSAALDGPAAELGREMRQGANTYFEYINSKGGVHGRNIKLISKDDGYEPDRAIVNTRSFIESEKAFALFGYVGTPTSYAVLPMVKEAGIPFFGAFTGAEGLRRPFNKYIFNIRAGYNDETAKLVDWLVEQRKTNIAVFYQNDSYGQAGLKGVKQAMARHKLKLAAIATVERNSTNVSKAVTVINQAAPDAVIMISAYKSCAAFIKGINKAGGIMDFLNVSFVGSRPLGEQLGRDGHGVMVSQVMPYPWAIENSIAVKFRMMLEKTSPDSKISFNNLEGFIGAMVLVEGLQRAGRDLTRDKLISALESIKNYDVGNFSVSFSPTNHNGSDFVQISMILGSGGQYVYVTDPGRESTPAATRFAKRKAERAKGGGLVKVRHSTKRKALR